jgi:hypothetical protein
LWFCVICRNDAGTVRTVIGCSWETVAGNSGRIADESSERYQDDDARTFGAETGGVSTGALLSVVTELLPSDGS